MKNKKIKWIGFSIFNILIIVFVIFTICKISQLQKKFSFVVGDDLVDITNYQKDFDFKAFENSILKNFGELEKSLVAIYVQKNIEFLHEGEDGIQTNIIETINKLEGNGIILTNDGYILTNKHVVNEKNSKYTIVIEEQEYVVDKIWYDDGLDLAIIKIKTKEYLTPVKVRKIQDKNQIGQIVFALKKDPDIKETIIKMGMINSLNQNFKMENNNIYVGLIKTSTAIEPGFSGGPLMNLDGEVIGINTAIDNIEYGASYSLPINQEFISQTLASIKESSKIVRPYLGFNYENHLLGIKVVEIDDDFLAVKNSELAIGDIITAVNNVNICYNTFLYELYTYKVHKQIILNVQRGSNKYNIPITLGTK